MAKQAAALDEDIMEAEKQAEHIQKELDALHSSTSASSSLSPESDTLPSMQPTPAHTMTPDMVQIMAASMSQTLYPGPQDPTTVKGFTEAFIKAFEAVAAGAQHQPEPHASTPRPPNSGASAPSGVKRDASPPPDSVTTKSKEMKTQS
eukprot:4543972-Karenia_brevis.AAC.1